MASTWQKLIEPEVKDSNYMLFTLCRGYKGNKRWPRNNLNTAYANIQIAMCQGSRDSTILFTDIHVSKVCYSDIHTLSIVDLIKSQHNWWTRARFRSPTLKYTGPNQSCPSVTSMWHMHSIAPGTWPTPSVPPSRLMLKPETRISRCPFIFNLRDSPQTLCFNFLPQCLLVQINSFSKTPNMKQKKQNIQNDSNKIKNKTQKPAMLKHTDGAGGRGLISLREPQKLCFHACSFSPTSF